MFPSLFFHEFFEEIPYVRQRGLKRGTRWGAQWQPDTVYWISLSLDEWWLFAKRQFFAGTEGDGTNSTCFSNGGVSSDEELRSSSKCDHHMMNWYLAYITSPQVVLVTMLLDMHDLGFDAAFLKHVGKTKEAFYADYNAFMTSGTQDDPPPPDFFPRANQSVREIVDFGAVNVAAACTLTSAQISQRCACRYNWDDASPNAIPASTSLHCQ